MSFRKECFVHNIRVVDLKKSEVITFDISNVKKILPRHTFFQFKYMYRKNTIFRIVVDEGDSTCVMSM